VAVIQLSPFPGAQCRWRICRQHQLRIRPPTKALARARAPKLDHDGVDDRADLSGPPEKGSDGRRKPSQRCFGPGQGRKVLDDNKDISTHSVYLPSGQRLEAHFRLGQPPRRPPDSKRARPARQALQCLDCQETTRATSEATISAAANTVRSARAGNRSGSEESAVVREAPTDCVSSA
jgi:hypothetical protein